jgi:hypothetical protein
MAEKQVPLSIIIRTVDKATAGIQAINAKLAVLSKPYKDLGKAAGDLREHLGLLGLDAVKGGFSGVATAVTGLLGKVALVGGAVGLAVTGLLSLVDHFDQLGDTAERLGTSADFLAAFRYAAERAGAPLEGVDQALQALVANMGQAKAGTGRMLKFLNEISPALARQITSAHSLEEALGLLADAEAKLPDAARRAALAQKTLGDPALAPLLARGSKGIQELLTRYYELAGAQGEAADAAGKTDDALKDLHASTDGVKAALVTGLAPALTVIIGKMTEWISGHRAEIQQWAEDIGKKLPAAVDQIVASVKSGIAWVTTFVDDIGGWQVAAVGLAAVISGPLISACVSLGIALLATPFGWVLASLAAIVLAIDQVIKHWDDLKAALDPTDRKSGAGAFMDAITKLPGMQITEEDKGNRSGLSMLRGIPGVGGLTATPVPIAPLSIPLISPPPPPDPAETKIKVEFVNAPRGMRVTSDSRGPAQLDLTTGYQVMGFGT